MCDGGGDGGLALGSGWFPAGERDDEFRAHTGAAFGVDGPVVGFDGTFDDTETEASAFDFLRGVVLGDAVEAFEDEGEVFVGDADAVVADAEDGGVGGGGHADGDEEPGVSGVFFEGVLHKVEENLVPVEAIARELVVGGEIEMAAGLFAFKEGMEAFEDTVEAFAAGEMLVLEVGDGVGFGGFKFGNVEHVLDEVREAFAVLLHDGEGALDGGAVVDVAFEKIFEIAVDDGEGGAEFVGSIGDEIPPDLLGFLAAGLVADDEAELLGAVGKDADGRGIEDEIAFLRATTGVDGDDEFILMRAVLHGMGLREKGTDAGVRENLRETASGEIGRGAEDFAGPGVGIEDFAIGGEEEAGVAKTGVEGIHQRPALLWGKGVQRRDATAGAPEQVGEPDTEGGEQEGGPSAEAVCEVLHGEH